MKTRKNILMIAALLMASLVMAEAAKENEAASKPAQQIRMAILKIESLDKAEISSETVSAQMNAIFSAQPDIQLVSRKELDDVAEEHGLNMTGLVDEDSMLKMGRFVSAQYIVAGSLTKIGQSFYLIVKIINVETTVQTTLTAKASGVESVFESCAELLKARIPALMEAYLPKPDDTADKLAEMKASVEKASLKGKVVMVNVNETYMRSPLPDPAAQIAVVNRLRELGFKVYTTQTKEKDWREMLMASGKFEGHKIDFLISGEGISSFAGRIKNLVSCRARVELNWIPLPGTLVTEVTAAKEPGIDLNEPLAAKTALAKAGEIAVENLIKEVTKNAKK